MTTNKTAALYTDENVVRAVAGQVIVLTLLALWFQSTFLSLFLAADFAIRAFTTTPSPLAMVAKKLLGLRRIAPKPIFAAPKKFAALLGWVFSLLIAAFLYWDLAAVGYVIGLILLVCAVLEAVFRICLGCYAYDWIVAPIINRINS